jgi:hypothetical protein
MRRCPVFDLNGKLKDVKLIRVVIPEMPVYSTLKDQLNAESWNMRMIQDSKHDQRSLPSLF